MSQEPDSLLARYASGGDEEAFRSLVANYIGLVYGVALRRLQGDASSALDVAQVVFSDLARKAGSLPNTVFLGGWLHQHACFVASKLARGEARRRERERVATEMSALHSNDDSVWDELSPILDEALQQLGPEDQAAIILRYFEGRDLRSVGQALGVSDDAAQKRVQRALEKLRSLLSAQGSAISAPSLAAALLSHVAPQVSAANIRSISAAALAAGAAPNLTIPLFLGLMKKKAALLILLVAGLVGFFAWKAGTSTNPLEQGEGQMLGSSDASPSSFEAGAHSANPAAEASSASLADPVEQTAVSTEPMDPAAPAMLIRIYDQASRQPIAGVSVEISTTDNPAAVQINNLVQTVASDETGLARAPIPQAPFARLQLHFSREGYAVWLSIWDAAKGEVVPTEHTVFLEPGVFLGGVVQTVGNEPIAGASVRVNRFWRGNDRPDRGNHRLELRNLAVSTDSSGRWSLKYVPESLLLNVNLRFAHPDFAETNSALTYENLASLRSGAFVTTLVQGMRLLGRVTDTNGVPLGGAQVAYGDQYSQARRDTVTDANGLYELERLTPYPGLREDQPITAMAEGFAPQTKRIKPIDGAERVNFILTPGAVIRGRVTDSLSQPIAGVRVSRERASVMEQDPIVWTAQTDADGRFEWNGAPHEPQHFYFGHRNYTQIRGRILVPGPQEHIIVLQPIRKVVGTLTDARTGEAVTNFFVLPAEGSEGSLSRWSESQDKEFQSGIFEVELQEERHNVLRIRANGFISRIFPIPADGSPLHAKLEPAAAIDGVIITAGGRPVPKAEVALLGGNRSASVALARGRFDPNQRRADYSVTDAEGRFSIQPSAPVNWIVAVSPAGFAQMPLSEYLTTRTLMLLPWARIEGVLTAGAAPQAGQQVVLTSGSSEPVGVRLDYAAFKTVTDAEGRFAFEMVPARPVTVARLEPAGANSFMFRDQTLIQPVPGETTQAELKSSAAP